MKNKNQLHKQVDLFTQDGDRMQWQKLPENDRRQTQHLLAHLLMKRVAHDFTCVQLKENLHAAEDNL